MVQEQREKERMIKPPCSENKVTFKLGSEHQEMKGD